MSFSIPQNKLLLRYAATTILFGVAFMVLHKLLLMLGWAPKSFLTYLPVVAGGTAVLYFIDFRYYVRRVHFKGAGTSTVPTVFFMSMMVIPWATLNWVAYQNDFIEEILSVKSITEAKSPYLHFTNLDVRKTLVIDDIITEKSTDDDGFVTTSISYTGLVPLAATPEDRVVSAWMEIQERDSQNDDIPETELKKFRDDLMQRGHARALNFPYDSIKFFKVVDDARYAAILNRNGLPAPDPIFLHGSLDTLSDYEMIAVQIFGWAYLGLSIFFLGAVAFGHYEPIADGD